ncbi:CoA-binding protein [Wenjunlia vitaminophila]|uniref:CoA-binding protein n=1 Tax=Wenjunlia vitaminophila TaxID=76728 RepID=A0A0T6LSK1_WENVI|nr:GNAT family N-acetyltransferase [Wenjunlia vitaminophila]KRV48984.1 CoA-binding protein [Wenjunlia vitaminophila]
MTQAERLPREDHALLADGTTVWLRPPCPQDAGAVRRMYEEMSRESLRGRFFGVSRESAEQAVERVFGPARRGYQALLAGAEDQVVGVAEYVGGDDEADVAELGVAVAERWHHRGVGTLLVEHLVHAAREAGLTALTADTLADNQAMLKVFADLGLPVSRRYEGGEVRCTVWLRDEQGRYLDAVDDRARRADVASMEHLLRPRCVAVVGAGRKPTSVGRAVLKNLRRAGYPGLLYVVNPHAHLLEHLPTYPKVGDLPHVPDLAVVTVPADRAAGVARECGRAGVRTLAVLTAGFTPEQGAELLAACRDHGMRLVGPNCLGLANTEQRARLNASFAPQQPLPGRAGVAVQSGGVGIALLEGLSRLGIGVSSFASLGDKYDVSGNDMLQWWESDGCTDLAVLHLESFGNPRAFSRTARRVGRRMPVLTVDAGRSQPGRRAAASHTAAAATRTVTRRALFTQAGVVATRSIAELLDAAATLHTQPLPAGTSVAIVSNAGGSGVLAADACVEAGLSVPELPAELVTALREDLPGSAVVTNPIDTSPAVRESSLTACVERLCRHHAVDAVVVSLVPTALGEATGEDLVRGLTTCCGELPCTLVAVLPHQPEGVRLLTPGEGRPIPAFADPQSAARALAHAAAYARWRARPAGIVPELAGVDTEGAAELVDAFLAAHPDGGWLDPPQCADLLDRYGVPQVPWAWVGDADAAADAAERLTARDGRAVLKAYGPGLLHKSERGAVLLDLVGGAQVRAGYQELASRFGDGMTGVLVQPMARRGTELFAGVVQDEVFGPLVLFGLGGTATEVIGDHVARLAPLTDSDVYGLLTEPRCAPLLFGHRGGEPVDVAGLEQLLLRLSRMAADLPQLAEADLNPVVARPDGVVTLDVRIRLQPARRFDPFLRRLR